MLNCVRKAGHFVVSETKVVFESLSQLLPTRKLHATPLPRCSYRNNHFTPPPPNPLLSLWVGVYMVAPSRL